MVYIDKNMNKYVPKKTIVFYTRESNDYNDDEVYAEIAEIKNGITMGYSPLSKDHLKGISKLVQDTIGKKESEFNFSKFETNREIIKAQFKNDKLSAIWFIKSRVANYETKKYSGLITYPNLIFSFKDSTLKIYATKKSKIDLNTNLYKAPFPNIYSSDKMCFGTMSVSDFSSNDIDELMNGMENAFFNSQFNSLMSENRTKSNTFSLFEKLTKDKGVFPNNELVPSNLKLKDVYR